MKILGAMVALAIMLAPAAVLAEKECPMAKKGEQAGGGDGAGEQWNRVAKKLELTDKQQAQLKDLREKHMEAMKPLREKTRDQMKALRDLVKDKADDKKIAAALDDLKKSREAMRAAQEKHKAECNKVLTPTQQAKMLLFMERQMGKGERPGMRERKRGGKRGERRGKE